MSSIIISFISAHLADILIALVVGGIFFYLGRNKISEYYKRVSATDFMIFSITILFNVACMIIIIGKYIDESKIHLVLSGLFFVDTAVLGSLLRQRDQELRKSKTKSETPKQP